MATLRDIRLKLGLTQNQTAELVGISQSSFCTYECGIMLPDIEIMINLEKQLGKTITWPDSLNRKTKHDVVQALIELSEHYPISSVAEFTHRIYRKGLPAEKLIIHFAQVANELREIEPLLRTEI